ncbi:hypothetical protein BOC46_20130 [Burkholderia pseudomallei]|nr:hypothetical protein BOC46_20130 [Burkholderia pseudomallei]
MLVSYSGAQQFTVFGKTLNSKGIIETCNFGSEKSDYITAVYDKNLERRHRAVMAIAKYGRKDEPLTANFIKQLDQLHDAPSVVRVEVRGKKLNGLALHDIDKLTNRFVRFTFADLNASGSELPKKLQNAFISLCRDRGVKAALEHYKGTPEARKINAFWRSHRASWWNPEPMMEQVCSALRSSGIFPVEAFDPPAASRREGDTKAPQLSESPTATAVRSTAGAKFLRIAPNVSNPSTKRTPVAPKVPKRGRVRRIG